MLLRLIKYPGSKKTLIPDIKKEFVRSGKKKFVDVFGGSGIVALNIPAAKTVYNDIEEDLVNLFLCVKESPDTLSQLLQDIASRKTKTAEYFRKGNIYSASGNGSGNIVATKTKAKCSAAADTLYRFTSSFGGMGVTYNTEEKSVQRYAIKTLEQFTEIQNKVSSWTIENMDYRELIEKYDTENTFFYFDPPYHAKKWYDYSFEESDYGELKAMLAEIKGSYLLNLNAEEKVPVSVFGKPNYTRSLPNLNQDLRNAKKPPRKFLFYTNF